jgi:hypothetical protein
MRREKTQINKIRNKKVEITTNTNKIQEIIRDYFENLYSNNLERMDKFLDIYDHQKLKQDDVYHLNRSVKHNETEAAIKSLPRKEPGPEGFSTEFYQISKEGLIPTSLNSYTE